MRLSNKQTPARANETEEKITASYSGQRETQNTAAVEDLAFCHGHNTQFGVKMVDVQKDLPFHFFIYIVA